MTHKIPVTFGTDGWRGIIADDFTFDNLSKVAEAAVRYFKNHKKIRNGVVIGYDARFMSGDFAAFTAEILANRGLKIYLADTIATTPMVSLAVKQKNAAGGIVITASHNPPRYNGFKLKEEYGGSAHPEMIARLEKHVQTVFGLKRFVKPKRWKTLDELQKKGSVKLIDLTGMYVGYVKRKIDLHAIRSAGVSMAFDAMYGAGAGIMGEFLDVPLELRKQHNPTFGGINPEPLAQNLGPLTDAMRTGQYTLGIATDGDADRLGAVDENGTFVDSHRIFALLIKYFHEFKGLRGEVVKSFSVTELVDALCQTYNIPYHITPIGFKHICRYMTERDILVGGEESGGIGVKNHIPERDGIFNGLLLAEMIAMLGKPLGTLVDELMQEFGYHYFNRVDIHLTPKEQKRMMKIYRNGLDTIAGYPIIETDNLDGYKMYFNNGWLLVRASGTESLIRFYAESDSPDKVEDILRFATSV
jgi:phosphomannomutase